MRNKLLLAAAVLLSVPLLASPAAVTAASSAPPSPAERYAQQAFDVTNAKRAQHGLAPQRNSKCLQRFAVAQAKRMAKQQRMFHQQLGPVMRRCRLSTAGENVAYGHPTGAATVNAWMRSRRGHREAILNRAFWRMSVAARRDSQGVWYVAQVFGRYR